MDRVYKKIEVVGISTTGFDDAVKKAIERAASTLHGLSWFEVVEQHGRIQEGKITEFQAVVKVAFKLD